MLIDQRKKIIELFLYAWLWSVLHPNSTKPIFKMGSIWYFCWFFWSTGGEKIYSTAMATCIAYCYQCDTTNACAKENPMKKLNDFFKCIYFFLWRTPLGQSHYLTPVTLGLLIVRKIFLVGNLFFLMCPSQCWSEHTAFYSMCGTILPSANGVHQAWWLQWLVQLPTTNQYIHTVPLGGNMNQQLWGWKHGLLADHRILLSTCYTKLAWEGNWCSALWPL